MPLRIIQANLLNIKLKTRHSIIGWPLLLQSEEMKFPISQSVIKVLIFLTADLICKVINDKHIKNIKASGKSVY